MSDIVERLRRGVDTNEPPDKTDRVMWEAADEIEQLRADCRHWAEYESNVWKTMKADIGRLRADRETAREALLQIYNLGGIRGHEAQMIALHALDQLPIPRRALESLPSTRSGEKT